MHTIVELPEYLRRAEHLLSERVRIDLVDYLAAHPTAGVIMQGTGGIRKFRWAREGMGKRGGVRVIYYYHDAHMPLYLLTIFGKGEQDNLTKAEQNALQRLVRTCLRRGDHPMGNAFESIQQGLLEAIAHASGQPSTAIVHTPPPIDVQAIRQHIGLTQTAFAAAFGISVSTLRHWERGDRIPRGPARVLLRVVATAPHAVLDALATC